VTGYGKLHVVVRRQQCCCTNIVLNHRSAAELALEHLRSLGHKRIAFMRGQPFSSDSDDRWRNVVQVAKQRIVWVRPRLCPNVGIETRIYGFEKVG
jgi:DNA-binding LacI/PurR family transcriptional regulator